MCVHTLVNKCLKLIISETVSPRKLSIILTNANAGDASKYTITMRISMSGCRDSIRTQAFFPASIICRMLTMFSRRNLREEQYVKTDYIYSTYMDCTCPAAAESEADTACPASPHP